MSEDGTDRDLETENTLRDRIGLSRIASWALLTGNRFAVTGVLAAIVFAAFLAASLVLAPSLSAALRSAAPLVRPAGVRV